MDASWHQKAKFKKNTECLHIRPTAEKIVRVFTRIAHTLLYLMLEVESSQFELYATLQVFQSLFKSCLPAKHDRSYCTIRTAFKHSD